MTDTVTLTFEHSCQRDKCLGFLWTDSKDGGGRRVARCLRCNWTIPLPKMGDAA